MKVETVLPDESGPLFAKVPAIEFVKILFVKTIFKVNSYKFHDAKISGYTVYIIMTSKQYVTYSLTIRYSIEGERCF